MKGYNKNKLNRKSETGSITLFVVLSMLFFLVFVLGAYTMIARRNQIQAESMSELKKIYKTNGKAQYDSIVGSLDGTIEISNQDHYYKIGTNSNIVVDGVSYVTVPGANYKLTNNIEINISQIEGFKYDLTGDSKYRFKDYLLYSDPNVNKNNKEVIYKFDADGDGKQERYILVAYSGKDNVEYSAGTYSQDKFSITDKVLEYSVTEKHNYLLYKTSTDTFDKLQKDITYYTETSEKTNLEYLNCYKDNVSVINAYFLFVEYNNEASIVGAELGKYAKVGDYVYYGIDYDNVNSESAGYKSSLKGWRVLSNVKNSDGTYDISLISAGTPLTYTYTGSDVTAAIDAMTRRFERTTFTDHTGASKLGSEFTNAFTDSISTIKYDVFSQVMRSSEDYIYEVGGIDSSNISNNNVTYSNWSESKNDLIDNGTSYWIPIEYVSNSKQILRTVASTDKLNYAATGTTLGIRPVVHLIKGVKITGGVGTEAHPYLIEKSENSLSAYGNPGEYVNYGVTYSNATVNSVTGSGTGWRILSNEGGVIKLISEGVPVKYKPGTIAIDTVVTNLTTNFENTTFLQGTGGTTKKGSAFKNQYATSIKAFDYEELSKLLCGSTNYISQTGQTYGSTGNTIKDKYNISGDIVNRHYTNWFSRKAGLINVGIDCILGSKDDSNKIVISKDEYLTTNSTSEEFGIRVVVTLSETTQIVGGTGTKADPYQLREVKTDISTSPVKTGDYVTYDGILEYNNVQTASLTDSTEDAGSYYRGWRVLDYDSTNKVLRLISAGVPYFVEANGNAEHNAKWYAEKINEFDYSSISIKDASGTDVKDNPFKSDLNVETYEILTEADYGAINAKITSGEVDQTMLFVGLKYWLGSSRAMEVAGGTQYSLLYSLTSEGLSETTATARYGLRPVITLTAGSTIEVTTGTGSLENPYVLNIK